MRATVETELVFPRPDPSDALRETLADINRLETTITELLTLARTANQPTAIDLASVLAPIAAAWQPRYQAASRTLTIAHAHYQPRPLGHPTMLSHALDVLLDNALTHGLGATTIEITHTEDTVTLTITDQGDGFPTTTPQTPATPNTYEPHGHGLPLAHRLISAMRGRLTITQPGPNPRIEIILRRPTT